MVKSESDSKCTDDDQSKEETTAATEPAKDEKKKEKGIQNLPIVKIYSVIIS